MGKTRKIIIAILIAMASAGLYATPWIQIGAIADYGISVSDESFMKGFGDISNYGFGAEARVNLFRWVSLDVPATFCFGDGMTISTRPSVNVNLPIASFMDIALGLGTELAFSENGDGWMMNGIPIADGAEALKESSLFYRGAMTFNLSFVSIGLAASIPMKGTFSSFDMAPLWESTRISASVLLNLV